MLQETASAAKRAGNLKADEVSWKTKLSFFVNGRLTSVNDAEPHHTLLWFLRERLGLTGTKLGCGEGGCGACTVTVSHFDQSSKKVIHRAVNACLAPLCSVDGCQVTTIEGIGTAASPHPAQKRIAELHGSQNEAGKSEDPAKEGDARVCLSSAATAASLQALTDVNQPKFPEELTTPTSESLKIAGSQVMWYRPKDLATLLMLKKAQPKAKMVAGNTEVGIETKFKHSEFPTMISTSTVAELQKLELDSSGTLIIGGTFTRLQKLELDSSGTLIIGGQGGGEDSDPEDGGPLVLSRLMDLLLGERLSGWSLARLAAATFALPKPSRTEGAGTLRHPDVAAEDDADMQNWSGTHQKKVRRVWAPDSMDQLWFLLQWATQNRQKARVQPSRSMSPGRGFLERNGLAMEERGMLSMGELDAIKGVDKEAGTITVQAGARVSQILSELQKHGLTLENFSSITEQQAAGWTQVSAHGTGARIPPVDEMLCHGQGDFVSKVWVRNENQCRLGDDVVVEEPTVTTRSSRATAKSKAAPDKAQQFNDPQHVIPRYTLHERTYCVTYDELERDHKRLLQTYRHVRYMWVPYTDTIVVVVSDVAEPGAEAKPALPEEVRVEPLKELLRTLVEDCGDLEGKNFAQLRERLLELDPLDPAHVAKAVWVPGKGASTKAGYWWL
ncbi:L-galactono-1,4-lactone dehydrogenase, mitochondrial [Symbiodinium microadriaticum]|uniref:L-galactono-1,4-lactone dehydrogenase, mitochondrial n=1 Tax=Symbiodinium microadriaticum TaxID=2951 RepID=A0A1Q9DWL5_SYMMI|nr:L-galactono-1,4-lactone dehydrogenase, mitochondrial [Symbiodinium microadriaticum]